MNDISRNLKELLDFEFKVYRNNLLIYKQFSSYDLVNFLQNSNIKDLEDIIYIVRNYVNSLNLDKDIKNLLNYTIIKNVNTKIEEIQNNNVNKHFEIDFKYFNYNEVKDIIEELQQDKLKVAQELGIF